MQSRRGSPGAVPGAGATLPRLRAEFAGRQRLKWHRQRRVGSDGGGLWKKLCQTKASPLFVLNFATSWYGWVCFLSLPSRCVSPGPQVGLGYPLVLPAAVRYRGSLHDNRYRAWKLGDDILINAAVSQQLSAWLPCAPAAAILQRAQGPAEFMGQYSPSTPTKFIWNTAAWLWTRPPIPMKWKFKFLDSIQTNQSLKQTVFSPTVLF